MRYWDTSALVPLFVAQVTSKGLRDIYESDRDCAVWCLTDVEAHSAFARLARERSVTDERALEVARQFDLAWEAFQVVGASDTVKQRAKRALRLHSLTSADALQLAAALTFVSDQPASLEFVCCDERLSDAARREGFRVLG